MQARVRGQINRDGLSLAAANGGQVVVGGERGRHIGGRDAKTGHALGIEPRAHREHAAAESVHFLHTLDRIELGNYDAQDVIRYRI